MTRTSFVLVVSISLLACSESKEDGSPGSGGAATGGSGGTAAGGSGGAGGGNGGSGGQAGSATGGAPSGGGAAGSSSGGTAGSTSYEQCGLTTNASSPIVVNEISASGDDWIELVNTSANPVDIAGMVIADVDTGTGCPKTTEAITFPSGATIAPGEHLLLVADQVGAPNTLQTSCLGGPPSCYHVGFGISGSAGDVIFLLNGTSLEAVGEIPANGAADGESWCRSPDITGPFGNCTTPTPGAANP